MSPTRYVLAIALAACGGARSDSAVEVDGVAAGASAAGAALTRRARPGVEPAVGRFGFVETVGDRRVLLLATEVDPSWARGAPRLASKPDDPQRLVLVDADRGALPRAFDVAGQAVDLYDGRRRVGQGTLGPVRFVAMSFDHEEPRSPTSSARPADDAIAKDSWDHGTRWLVADLGSDVPGGASWGRLSSFGDPLLPELAAPDSDLAAAADAMLAADRASGEAQDLFEAHFASVQQPKPADRWEQTGDASHAVFSHRGETFVHARVEAGEPCWFSAVVAKLYRKRGKALEPVPGFTNTADIELLIDVDGDGSLEAVAAPRFGNGRALVRFHDGHVLLDTARPEHNCPC